MKQFARPSVVQAVLFCFIFSSTISLGEAVDDKFSQISPRHNPGAGEFVHGQGYGKILVRLTIFGAVKEQGVHYVPEGTDLVFALVYAGGYTDQSKLDRISIRRRNLREPLYADLDEIMSEGNPVPKLQDGDVITVPFNWKKDLATMLTVTGFVTSVTGFVVSVIALTKKSN